MKSLAWLSSCSGGGGPWEGRLCSFRGNTREPRQRLGVQGPSWIGVGGGGRESREHQIRTRSGLGAGPGGRVWGRGREGPGRCALSPPTPQDWK